MFDPKGWLYFVPGVEPGGEVRPASAPHLQDPPFTTIIPNKLYLYVEEGKILYIYVHQSLIEEVL